jgi:hypothetical protein
VGGDSIRDVATFANPNQLAIGMQNVLVNGVPVIADGVMTNALPGRVLRARGIARHDLTRDVATSGRTLTRRLTRACCGRTQAPRPPRYRID